MTKKIIIAFTLAVIAIGCTIIGNWLFATGRINEGIMYLLMAIVTTFFEAHVIDTYRSRS